VLSIEPIRTPLRWSIWRRWKRRSCPFDGSLRAATEGQAPL
jgi:hypothetical protein